MERLKRRKEFLAAAAGAKATTAGFVLQEISQVEMASEKPPTVVARL